MPEALVHAPSAALAVAQDRHASGQQIITAFVAGDDVAEIDIQSIDRAVRVNSIAQPKYILLGIYSIPFCIALSLYRDPIDPRSFDVDQRFWYCTYD